MVNSNSKGDRAERELVNGLDEVGWRVMRAPSSGSSTERELPDVLAGRDGVFVAIESKASSSETVYVQSEEVEALCSFSEDFGAEPRLSFRFDEESGDPTYGNKDVFGAYLFHPDDLYRTGSGNYRVKKEKAVSEGVLYCDLYRNLRPDQ